MPRPNGPKAGSAIKRMASPPKALISNRSTNRAIGLRKPRHAPPQSPSTVLAVGYMQQALKHGSPAERLGFFGALGRKETLKKGLARLSPRMARRARKRATDHAKYTAIREEFARGEAKTGRTV